jgi:hypothetical protein
MIQYTKLKDGYGIRSTELNLQQGDAVKVECKSGQFKEEIIGKKLWEGPDKYNEGQTIALYSKMPPERVIRKVTCPKCRLEFDPVESAREISREAENKFNRVELDIEQVEVPF